MGALLGGEVVEAGPGDLVFKPRNQWHTFWNAADEPCRILELISPAGFERFFQELVDMGGVTQPSQSPSPSFVSTTGSRCSQRPFPSYSSASGCAWASRSPAAGRRDLRTVKAHRRDARAGDASTTQGIVISAPITRRGQNAVPGGRRAVA
jgi:Cupin domain